MTVKFGPLNIKKFCIKKILGVWSKNKAADWEDIHQLVSDRVQYGGYLDMPGSEISS